MDLINYNDLQNQINEEKENFFDEKAKKVQDLLKIDNGNYIYNIYKKLIDIDESIKNDNIETIIFIINILLKMHKEDNICKINDFNFIYDLFILYYDDIIKLYNNNDFETISIIFYTYIIKIYNCNIYDIFLNLI